MSETVCLLCGVPAEECTNSLHGEAEAHQKFNEPEPTLYFSLKRLDAVFQRLITLSDTIPAKQPPEERQREDEAIGREP